MFKNFMLKLKESFMAVFPITLMIFALIIFLVPTENDDIVKLIVSAVLLLAILAVIMKKSKKA